MSTSKPGPEESSTAIWEGGGSGNGSSLQIGLIIPVALVCLFLTVVGFYALWHICHERLRAKRRQLVVSLTHIYIQTKGRACLRSNFLSSIAIRLSHDQDIIHAEKVFELMWNHHMPGLSLSVDLSIH